MNARASVGKQDQGRVKGKEAKFSDPDFHITIITKRSEGARK